MVSIIQEKLPQVDREKIIELFRKSKVAKAFLFGSITTQEFQTEKSDIDIIIELEEMPSLEKGETLMNLWEQLEKIFERKVDLITDKPIKNPYFKKAIERSKVLIYDRESEEIFV